MKKVLVSTVLDFNDYDMLLEQRDNYSRTDFLANDYLNALYHKDITVTDATYWTWIVDVIDSINIYGGYRVDSEE
jgi:hypothetical protein